MSGVTRAVIGVASIAAAFIPGVGPALALALQSVGTSLLLGAATEALAGRPKAPKQVIEGNVRGSTETHLLVFGERRVGGLLVQLGTSGTNNSRLWMGLAHSVVHPGGCEGLQGLYVNDEYVPLVALGALDGSTDVSHTGSGATPVNLAGQLNLAFYRGTGTQAADSQSVAAGIDISSDWRRGICWTRFLLRMNDDSERFQQAYPNGIPTFNVQLRGWRVYDPRLDSTRGGSGSQRADNPLTWTWSRNPALCAATYAIAAVSDGGCGEPIAAQNWASVAAAANICDETISTPAGSQPRFTCDAVLETAQARKDNLQILLDCMGGMAPIIGGQRTYLAAAYQAPVTTIDDSWLRGPVEDIPAPPLDSIRNRIVAVFPDATNNWKDADTPEFAAATLLDGDGDPLAMRLDLPAVTRPYAAQYLAQIALRRSRNAATLKLALNLRGLDIYTGETVAVTLPELGLNGATYRVVEWRWNGLPEVTLRADAAADYAVGSFAVPVTPQAVSAGGATLPGAPSLLTALGLPDGVALNWRNAAGTLAADPTVATYVIERVVTQGTGWAEIARTPVLNYLDTSGAAGTVYDYRVRGANARGQTGSASAPATAGPRSLDDPQNLGVINPGFEGGVAGWAFGTGWAIQRQTTTGGGIPTTTMRARTGVYSARKTGVGNANAVNDGVVAVSPGQRVSARSYWYRDDTGTAGNGRTMLRWLDVTGTSLSVTIAPFVDGTVSGGGIGLPQSQWEASSISNAVAPASAAFVRLELEASGTIRVDDCAVSVAADSNLDDLPDGPSYGRVLGSELTAGQHNLSVSGGATLPPRNVPAVRLANVGALWSGLGSGLSATFDGASPSNVTISFTSQSLRYGISTPFNAASVALTQTRGTIRTYRVYFTGDSTVLDGGTQTLAAAIDDAALVDAPHRIFVGRITVSVGSTAGTTGTGTNPTTGGGGYVSY